MMENDVQENKLKLSIEYVNEDSNNSVDDDNFQTSAKLISLNQMGLTTEKVQTNPKKKLSKKNTRVSSNVEEDLYDVENENDNFSPNKFLHLNIQSERRASISSLRYNEAYNSDNNLNLIKDCNLNASNPNITEINLSDNKLISESSNIKKVSNLYSNNPKVNLMRVSSFSPNKKKRKLVLEEKQKVRGHRRSIYAIPPPKEEIIEEEKSFRKDFYGTPICKKNKKKVKVTFKKNFEIVTPIESFKKYNVITGIPKDDKYINGFETCECCIIN
jgi:hypothetical protein